MFQFTHPVWGATASEESTVIDGTVSIHAPRVGCDYKLVPDVTPEERFNSRTPCGVRQHLYKRSLSQ